MLKVGTPVLRLCSSTGDLIILHERRRRIRKFQEIIVEFSKAELMDNQNSAKFIPYGKYYIPLGISPLSLAILKRDQDSLHIILREKEEWICSRDDEGRTAFHYAASIGYLHGVEKLLATDLSWQWDRDSHGLFPIHWASAGGHLKVVEKLLEYCSDPREMLDNNGRNIVHIAAQMGKLNVITYILQATKNHHVENVINDKDKFGNAPLHLASLHFHPKIVHTLTRDPGVDLTSVNKNNETALDVFMNNCQENLPLRQAKSPNGSIQRQNKHPYSGFDPDNYSSICRCMPGGTNDSEGMAVMLKHAWFKPFIFCITISMYGSIGVTIILIWTQLGDSTLALYALKIASPLLGISLTTLSVAFMAGVYLVISDLSWLATTFLVLCAVCIVMLLLLYTILWFPSPSSKPWIRCISHYPFLFQTWLVERDDSKVAGLAKYDVGLLAIADDTLSEQTPIYFHLSNTTLASSTTFFCVDQTRSSQASDVAKPIYGSKVPVLSDEKLSMRVLVDHSIIESFAQGGRTVISGRVYPTKAIYGAARLFLFNNATNINIKVTLKIWQLNSAFIRPFPFDQSQ
ncbi:hypothetical protein VNO78_12641 [Psophocarpus tetragonolobus]|uniref:Uncharacterized protein n=1 Tax=Psophocarpus tetragonolobus TaxID=3891 RepID=A0AAN9SQ90_PSOTE